MKSFLFALALVVCATTLISFAVAQKLAGVSSGHVN